ncbi:hypothetical protein AB0399_09590 [Streptomyces sp. NPDC088194]|uniref:hypothetical protein n=1 Tax=Streptomyces sp. NPDC088194 TaxID=3154931 RepID=UPI00344C728B
MSSRQRPALATVAAVLALAACPMLAGASATAAPATAPADGASARAGGLLPPIGAEIPSSMLAINSELEVKGATYHVDFRGGIKQRVDVNPNDPLYSVRLRTVGFKVSAEIDSGKYNYVVFEQNDVDVDVRSTLTLTQQFPPRYVERDELSFSAVFEPKDGGEPLVLVTKEPMVLTASLTQYPARGDQYRLDKPVDLVDPEHPDNVEAVLKTFPSKRGGL